MTRLDTLAMRERLGWLEPVEALELARLRARAAAAEREHVEWLERLWAEQDRELATRIAAGRKRRGPDWLRPMGADEYLDARKRRVIDHPESHAELCARTNELLRLQRDAMRRG